MPSGPIDEEDGVGSLVRPCLGDFREVQVHRFGVQKGRIRAAPLPCFGQMAPKCGSMRFADPEARSGEYRAWPTCG